jgi:hypothetical protein
VIGTVPAKLLILARRDIAFEELALNCGCEKISSRKLSFLKFYSISKDIYQALNWATDGARVQLRSVSGTLLKTLVKRNRLFTYKIIEFTFTPNNSCTKHTFAGHLSCWNSTSSSKLGFPWERDTFFNSLSFFRNDFMDLYCFGGRNSIAANGQFEKNIEVLPVRSKLNNEIIGRWKSTKFFLFDFASIIHGNVLVYESEVVLKDFSLQSYKFPHSMIPNSVWINPLSVGECLIPKFNSETKLQGTHLFIDANANLYHFVAESIRVLIFALQEGLDFEGIVIRDNLPRNFYELINFIAPYKTIYKVRQGEKVSVSRIIACGFETPESQKSNFFSRSGGTEFNLSDDFIPFFYIRNMVLNNSEIESVSERLGSNQLKKKIVFSIRPVQHSRGFFFSELVSRILKWLGATVLDLNTSSFSSSVDLIHQADYFFCESGAGVVNILFGKSDLNFIEISYGNRQNWSSFASVLKIHHEEVKVSSLFQNIFKDYLDSNPFPIIKILSRYLVFGPVLRNLK